MFDLGLEAINTTHGVDDLVQELLQSQLLVRHLLDICCRYLAITFALLPEGNASQRMHAGGKVGVGLTLALRHVLVHCPQSLVALDLKPLLAALDATRLIEVRYSLELFM